MKLGLAQINVRINDFESNTKKIIDYILKAANTGADIVVFPELALVGYPPSDFLEYDDYMQKISAHMQQIASVCIGCCAIVGAPSVNTTSTGRKRLNSAYILFDGKIQQIVHKTNLPIYDVFDESRFFEPNQTFTTVLYKGYRLAVVICEDTWDSVTNPMEKLILDHPDCIINISASPFSYTQIPKRLEMMRKQTEQYKIPMFYVNHIGAQTDLIFDGGSICMNKDGHVCGQMPYFAEGLSIFDSENLKQADLVEISAIEGIYRALVLGIKDFFFKLGLQKAILGLSGGIDSAVVCVLAVDALGAENVHGVLMPSPYSSKHSIDDAKQLAENLGVSYDLISIDTLFSNFNQALLPVFTDRKPDLTEENIQARIRGVLLMAISNKMGYVLLNTSNKSEMAVGYGTLYGDMCGALSVLGDLYKTQVYELAQFMNRKVERIPINSIEKPPSAELRDHQKDTDSLPPYEVLDAILFAYIENREGVEDIVNKGFDYPLVHRVLGMINKNEFKRYQAAPVLRVSSRAFGKGWAMPIVAKQN